MDIEKIRNLEIETDRLIIRRFKKEDAKTAFENWGKDKEVSKFLDWNVYNTEKELEDVIISWSAENQTNYQFAVILKEINEVIGSFSVRHSHEMHKMCDVGYSYGSKYWGQGYAKEVLEEMIKYLIKKCNVDLVEAKHIEGNPASGAVMQKAGMTKDAVLRKRRVNKDTNNVEDLIIYSITKNEV